jgi:hypothetical protein
MSSAEDLMGFFCFGPGDPRHSHPCGWSGLLNPGNEKGGMTELRTRHDLAVMEKQCRQKQWTRRDLNPWPSRCKRDDLPLIYEPAAAGCGILFFSGFHIVVTDQVAARQMKDEKQTFPEPLCQS